MPDTVPIIPSESWRNAPVSICLATCNGERYLAEQLASVLSQLCPLDEVIVSDDGSGDGTLAVLERFVSPQFRLLPAQRFGTPIRNFEYVLGEAKHDIIALCDQDDIWLPHKLETVRRVLGGRGGMVAAMMTDAELIDAAGRPLHRRLFEVFPPRTGRWRNIYRNCYTGCAMAITRPLLELALPFPAGIPMHDSWLGLLAEARGEVFLVPDVTFQHRRHGRNASYRRRNPLRQIAWRVNLACRLRTRLAGRKRSVEVRP